MSDVEFETWASEVAAANAVPVERKRFVHVPTMMDRVNHCWFRVKYDVNEIAYPAAQWVCDRLHMDECREYAGYELVQVAVASVCAGAAAMLGLLLLI